MKPTVHYNINSLEGAASVKRIIEVALDGLVVMLYNDEHLFRIEEYAWLNATQWSQSLESVRTLLKDNANYSETRLMFRHRAFTLAPSHLVSPAQQQEVLELLCKDRPDFVRTASVNAPKDARLIWGGDKEIKDFLLRDAQQVDVSHTALSMLNHSTGRSLQKEEVFLTVYTDYFELLAIRNGEVQLINTYDFKTDKDFIYILLTVLQQVQLDREVLRLNVSGKIAAGSKLHRQLTTYIKQVGFLPLKLKQEIDDVPLYHYPHLVQSSELCEL